MNDVTDRRGFSIILCTYRRPECLENLLRDLQASSENTDISWELVLVDNADDPATRKLSVCREDWSFQMNYIVEREEGLSAARNRGVKEARYDWLLFLDDDVRLETSFIGQIAEAIALDGVEMICPRIIMPVEPNWPHWLKVRIDTGIGQFDLGNEIIKLTDKDKTPIGACVGAHRSVIERFGPFPTELDRKGRKGLLGGGESKVLSRALESKANAIYLPGIVVRHEYITNKKSKRYWRRHALAAGKSYVISRVSEKDIQNSVSLTAVIAMSSVAKAILRTIMILTSPSRAFENQYRALAHFGRVYEATHILLKGKY